MALILYDARARNQALMHSKTRTVSVRNVCVPLFSTVYLINRLESSALTDGDIGQTGQFLHMAPLQYDARAGKQALMHSKTRTVSVRNVCLNINRLARVETRVRRWSVQRSGPNW